MKLNKKFQNSGIDDNPDTAHSSFEELTPDEAEQLAGGTALTTAPKNEGCPVYNTGCGPKEVT